MSNGDDVLENWEEIDEEGLCMTLKTKLQTEATQTVRIASINPATVANNSKPAAVSKMKVLQRPQSLPEATGAAATTPKQITIAKKPQPSPEFDGTEVPPPVLMVLHKSASEYDAANYATPISNQTVKILRRPAQADERRDPNGMRPKQPIKTLKQREQEYAKARLRILGAAKNPEDDKPDTTPSSTNNSTTTTPLAHVATTVTSNNNNNIGNSSNSSGMHRSNSAPKMNPNPQGYNMYNNYFQAPHMNYFYQGAGPMTPQSQLPPPHYNQRMPPPPYAAPPQAPNAQQSWSPVVGGSVSAALLRQQQQQQQQQQHHHPAAPSQSNPYNDNVLRLPRGPCPNGTMGFQMRR